MSLANTIQLELFFNILQYLPLTKEFSPFIAKIDIFELVSMSYFLFLFVSVFCVSFSIF